MRMSGSTLAMVDDHCMATLDHREAGAPRDDSMFGPGIVAHAVLEGCHRLAIRNGDPQLSDAAVENVADAVVDQLTTQGRSYRGKSEPPVSPIAAIDGRDAAISWARRHTFPLTLAPEVKLNADDGWNPRPANDDKAPYTGILDLYGPDAHEEEDGNSYTGVYVGDYKTAWHTGAGEVDSYQFRLYTLLAIAHNPTASYVRRVVHNVRTGQSFEDILWLDDDGQAMVRKWRRDIAMIARAADHRGPDGKRAARPGAACIGCPYVVSCPSAVSLLGIGEDAAPEAIAAAYAVADARREALGALARKAAPDAPVAVPGGVVGYLPRNDRKPAPDVAQGILRRFYDGREDTRAESFLAVHGMEVALLSTLSLGAGNVESFAKSVTTPAGKKRRKPDERQAGDDLAASLTVPHVSAIFGCRREKPLDGNTDRPLGPAEAAAMGPLFDSSPFAK